MDTQGLLSSPVKPQRRRHSREFKEQVLTACNEPGASIASVAHQFNVNANLIHKWRRAAQPGDPEGNRDFIKVPMLKSAPASASSTVKIELASTHGPVVLHWPMDPLDALTTWLRPS